MIRIFATYSPLDRVVRRYYQEPFPPNRLMRTHAGKVSDSHPPETHADVIRGFRVKPPEACRLERAERIA